MNVLVDTSVWSLALRRNTLDASPESSELVNLIGEGRVVIIGAIRQELLSGVRNAEQIRKLRDSLASFPDIVLDETDYVEAARLFNSCRSRGIQGSNTDFLICAVAVRLKLSILTTDKDFDAFARLSHLKLHTPR